MSIRKPIAAAAIASTIVLISANTGFGASNVGSNTDRLSVGSMLRQLIRELGLRAAPTGCWNPAPGAASCDSQELVRPTGRPFVTSSPAGYGPIDLRSAYNLPAAPSAGAGQTVAIVDAQDDPNAEADLATYRSTYGLTPCTTANGCFRKVNQSGAAGPLPAADAGWATEISLDLDMVSAICPSCHILLVEAASPNQSDLSIAENAAASLGATEISNSYGSSESISETSSDVSYDHPGIAITAASGDSGYGVQYPAASPFVTAVGGTTLDEAGNTRGWSEAAWSGTGAGCSAFEPKPSWQQDAGCSMRTVADVSAVADPSTGVAVYDTYGGTPGNALLCLLFGTDCPQPTGWFVVGGTSVSSPIVASVFALAGNAASVDSLSYPYDHASSLYDVTTGSDGGGSPGIFGLFSTPNCGSYLCNAGPGYDGPTGLGTPDGTGAF
jgi:subtilase family serine protease